MRRIFAVILAAMLLFAACSEYAEPDVNELVASLTEDQSIEEPSFAEESDIPILFDIDVNKVESFCVCYSGVGAKADMVAAFCLSDKDDASAVQTALLEYKEHRYKDFEGYAPLEAEKVEDGVVAVYGRYVLLMILPDIELAITEADEAFTK